MASDALQNMLCHSVPQLLGQHVNGPKPRICHGSNGVVIVWRSELAVRGEGDRSLVCVLWLA